MGSVRKIEEDSFSTLCSYLPYTGILEDVVPTTAECGPTILMIALNIERDCKSLFSG
jgi:hypothetical protein